MSHLGHLSFCKGAAAKPYSEFMMARESPDLGESTDSVPKMEMIWK